MFSSRIPVIVYAALIVAFSVLGVLYFFLPDFSSDLLAELIGAVFVLLIIDNLMVRSRAKKWHAVDEEMKYLASRLIFRLRDGVAWRVFDFRPALQEGSDQKENMEILREKRHRFLLALENLSDKDFEKSLSTFFENLDNPKFSASQYEYFFERAKEVWDLMDMKYSDFIDAAPAEQLLKLYIHLKDLCAAIRIFERSRGEVEGRAFYEESSSDSITFNLQGAVKSMNRLKELGYSEPPKVDECLEN